MGKVAEEKILQHLFLHGAKEGEILGKESIFCANQKFSFSKPSVFMEGT